MAIKIPSDGRSKRRKVNIDSKSASSRNKRETLHENSGGEKTSKRSSLRATGSPRGVAPQNARLTLLELKLVEYCQYVGTPFSSIKAISNPGLNEILTYPALEFWWESYRTVGRDGSNNSILRLQQEVVTASNVFSNLSTESEARRQCYGLQEEVESRIIGRSPVLTNEIEVLFPLYDIDSSFTAIESGGGLFVLTTYYSLTWQISKSVRG